MQADVCDEDENISEKENKPSKKRRKRKLLNEKVSRLLVMNVSGVTSWLSTN